MNSEKLQERADEIRKDDSMPDKEYRVGFWYTEYGSAYVVAESAEQAEQWLYDELSQNGLDDIEYKCNDRDYGAQDAELWNG